MSFLYTANSGHKFCFVCRRNNVRLHVINESLIRNIFLKNRIVVKPDSRHCNRHFFNSDYLSENFEQYSNI
jgi:hypothetical protein